MELRREIPKLLGKRRESTDLFNDGTASTSQLSASTRPTSTPVRMNNPSEDEDSPYFPCSTQEMHEDVDVLWDWNSPQSKPKTSITRKSRKKLNLQHSPKVPLRRHPSNNNEQIKQDFNKLREELRALKAEIAKPDHEESLVLSPREEEVFKMEANDHIEHMLDFDHNEHLPEIDEDDFQDPFDDDMDEKLILFSQQVEASIFKPVKELEIKNSRSVDSSRGSSISSFNAAQTRSNNCLNSDLKKNSSQPWNENQFNLHTLPKLTVNHCDIRPSTAKTEYSIGSKKEYAFQNFPPSVIPRKNTESKLPFQNPHSTNVKGKQITSIQDSEVFNDSLENALSQMDDDDFDQLTQVVDIKNYKSDNNCKVDKKSKGFPRSLSEDLIAPETVQMASGKVEWHRTQSFESYNAQLSKEKLQEIERKRLEAKAKRDAKKKQEIIPTVIEVSDSPIKCSPDEIEKKRLQALEKLEAKRIQDIIEKKKQEALKRREESRKKNAANVKSSLCTRM